MIYTLIKHNLNNYMKLVFNTIVFSWMSLTNIYYSQDLFFINNKSYPTNGTFTFTLANPDFYDELEVLVAKDGVKGILAISIKSDYSVVTGKTILYLENGSVINLIDRFIYDNMDGKSTTVYNITPSEIEIMKKFNVIKIRFSEGPPKGHPAECRNYSAENYYMREKIFMYGRDNVNDFQNEKIRETTETKYFFNDFF